MKWLLFISACILSVTAAYFSVFGLTKLFSGAFYPVLFMASGLELSKLITISYLTRNWNIIPKIIRLYMISATIVLIILTSIGIYGFLVSSYQESKKSLLQSDSNIEIYTKKIETFNLKIKSIDENINILSNRLSKLSNFRESQEYRLDTLYNRKRYSSIKTIQSNVSKTENDIQNIDSKLELLYLDKSKLNDSIVEYNSKINNIDIEVNNSDIGPIKYVSDLSGLNIDVTINYFIFIIIFVFDPMAIILFIAFNRYKNPTLHEENKSTDGFMNDDGEFEISFINEMVKDE